MAARPLDELRKEARKLENEIDLKLVSYSKYSTNLAQSSMRRDVDEESGLALGGLADTMSLDIGEYLSKLNNVNEEMSRCSESRAFAHIIHHHRAKLHDYTQDFRRIKANIQATREHADLLMSVRDDISQYRESGTSGRTDSLLRERGATQASERIASQILDHAMDTKAELGHQRAFFEGTLNKLTSVGGTFPAINSVVTKIKRQKSRDCIILSLVIATCIAFIFLYWWHN